MGYLDAARMGVEANGAVALRVARPGIQMRRRVSRTSHQGDWPTRRLVNDQQARC
jgi:hypothetical protein